MNQILLATLCGILYWIGTNRIGYGLTTATGSPIFYGLILGAIYGQVQQGLIIGGTIQLVYLGMIATGGNIPADQALAGIVAIPIALETGLSPEMAVGVAVPFGVLGVFLDQLRRTSNSFWIHRADKDALEGDRKGIFHNAFTLPAIVSFVLRFIPVFIITMFGAEAVTYLLTVLPQWIITGLSVAGGILPAMGFAIIILTIGKKELMPYFVLGFFAVAYLQINVMAAAIFGGCIALLIMFREGKKEA